MKKNVDVVKLDLVRKIDLEKNKKNSKEVFSQLLSKTKRIM